MVKNCNHCNSEKPLQHFGKSKRLSLGRLGTCRECLKEYNKKLNEKRPWVRFLGGIKYRCGDLSNHLYGGAGIKALLSEGDIKRLWLRDKAFKMKQPSIDRLDSSGNYEYRNCRFLEMPENAGRKRTNKLSPEIAEKIRSEYVPRTVSAGILAKRYGVSDSFIRQLIRGEWYKKRNKKEKGAGREETFRYISKSGNFCVGTDGETD